MTDSKTARERAEEIVDEIVDEYYGAGLLERDFIGLRQDIEKAILSYASDKDKRIAQLEAEVEQVSRYRYIASNELERIKELIGGASLHEETGVSLYDDVKDLMAENEKLRCACNSSSYAYLDLKKELTSLKSSLAEKAGDVKYYHDLHKTAHNQIDILEAQLASLKQENERLKSGWTQQEFIADLQHRREELKSQVVSKDALIQEWQLACGKTNRIIQQVHECLTKTEAEKSKTIFELIAEHKAENKRMWSELARLQLENGVMREALRGAEPHVMWKARMCENVEYDLEQAGKARASLKQIEAALSPSTKSSLMEKVRGLMSAVDKFIDAENAHTGDWDNMVSALTEVKKDIQ